MESKKTCIYIGVQFVLALSAGWLVRGVTINLEAACILCSWSLKQPYFVDLYLDLLMYFCFLENSSLILFCLQAIEWVPSLSAPSGSIKDFLRYFKAFRSISLRLAILILLLWFGSRLKWGQVNTQLVLMQKIYLLLPAEMRTKPYEYLTLSKW